MTHRKLVHVIDSGTIGGGPRVLLAAARSLSRYGWDSQVVCGDDGPLAANLAAAGIPAQAWPIAGKYRFLGNFPALVRYLRKERPAAVVVYGPIAGCIGGAAARMARAGSIVYGAGYPSYYADRGLRRRVRNALVEHISCTCADAVWCKSSTDLQLYRAREAALSDTFHLVPNCVAQDLVERLPTWDSAAVDRFRSQFGLAHASPLITYVGRLVSEKGVDVLLHAYSLASQELQRSLLVVVGEGPERANLERLSRDLGIADRVVFVGAHQDVAPFYVSASVVVIPSRYEPFGNVAIEAMAAARPVVASRVGGLADTVVDGECGRLVAAGDPIALAHAIRWVLQTPQHACQLGMAGRHRALAEYTEERLATRLDQLLRIGLSPRLNPVPDALTSL